jgi:hypothetical protein
MWDWVLHWTGAGASESQRRLGGGRGRRRTTWRREWVGGERDGERRGWSVAGLSFVGRGKGNSGLDQVLCLGFVVIDNGCATRLMVRRAAIASGSDWQCVHIYSTIQHVSLAYAQARYHIKVRSWWDLPIQLRATAVIYRETKPCADKLAYMKHT